MLKISVSWLPGAGLWIVVLTCSKSSSFSSVILHRAVFISIFRWFALFTVSKELQFRSVYICVIIIFQLVTTSLNPSASVAFDDIVNYSSFNINQFSVLPNAKETMHEHDKELETYDNVFKSYFQIKVFDDCVFTSLRLIACRICVFLSDLFQGSKFA